MKLSFVPHFLEFKYSFGISSGTRNQTPVVFTKLEYENFIGYGEASMPPYLGESHESVIAFLQQAAQILKNQKNPLALENILHEIDALTKNNSAAKTSVDIALHDLLGKIKNQAWHQIWKLDKSKTPFTVYTIGIGDEKMLEQKIKDVADFKILKIKLGTDNDKKLIEKIRTITDKPLVVDVNQGWADKHFVLEMIQWLAQKNVLFVEQPMKKNELDEIAWVNEKSPIPIIADESFQRLNDLKKIKGAFSGINIKLMKCTGMNEAFKIIKEAKKTNLKILVGCMSETSCAVSAAAQLTPLADWVDLDGPLLIKKDFFEGIKFSDGKIILNDLPGIGVSPREELKF